MSTETTTEQQHRAVDHASQPTQEDARGSDLIDTSTRDKFSTRWDSIQTKFVDEPKEAVAEADALVGELTEWITARFRDQRQSLEGQWQRDEEPSTEDLRRLLQDYRSFFSRLLQRS